MGAGHEQLQSIILAKKLGLYVISIDKNKKCIGKNFSDKFYNISVKETKKILELSKKNKIKSIIAPCSDLALKNLNLIKGKLKINNFSKNLLNICTNKFHMKKFFHNNNLKTSKYFIFDDYSKFKKKIKKLNLPCVIKPLDSFGQKGVIKIENLKNIKKIINKSKRYTLEDKLICEEFVSGKEINVVILVEKSKIKILSLSERKTYANSKGFGIAYAHKYPADIKKIVSKKILRNVSKCVKKLGLTNGVLYPQIIIDKKEQINFIEIAARLPGGCMPELALLASGYDIRLFEILNSFGIKDKIQISKIGRRKKKIYIKFFTKKEIKNLKMMNLIKSKLMKDKNVHSINYQKIKKIPEVKNSSSRFLSVIFTSNMNKKKNVDIEKNSNYKIKKIGIEI